MIDWLDDHNGFVQAILVTALVVVTFIYAFYTSRLVSETERARQDSDRPQILIEVSNLDSLTWEEVKQDKPVAVVPDDPYHAYPKVLNCRIVNLGRGAAKEISVVAAHDLMSYMYAQKEFLAPSEEWSATIEAWPFRQADRLARKEPVGWAAILQSLTGEKAKALGFDFGIILSCRDVHDRVWITYLKYALAERFTMGSAPDRTLIRDVQRIVPGRKD